MIHTGIKLKACNIPQNIDSKKNPEIMKTQTEKPEVQMDELSPGKNRVYFFSQGYKLAGDLYLPENFNPSQKYPTIIFTRPGTQVKEQTGAVYGQKLANKGYAFLVFDPQNFGDSEGEVRNHESMHSMVPNTIDAVSFLRTMDCVDRDNFFGLGLCAGSPYICNVAIGDSRIKAVGTVVGNFDAAAALFGNYPTEAIEYMLNVAAEGRQHYYETGEYQTADVFSGIPMPPPENMPKDIQDIYQYYFVRAGKDKHPNYSSEYPTIAMPLDPARIFTVQAKYFTTPLLVIAGENAFTKQMDKEVYDMAVSEKEWLELEGASHLDLYDIDQYVDQAVSKVVEFFKKHSK